MSGERFNLESVRTKAMAMALAASLAVSGCAHVEFEAASPETSPQTELVGTQIPGTTSAMTSEIRTDCIEPSSDDVLAVQALLSKPQDPLAEPMGGSPKTDADYKSFPAQQQAFKERVAREHGLTIFDDTPWQRRLTDQSARAEGGLDTGPFSDYLGATQDFMNQFGVEVAVGTPDLTYSYGARAPRAEELESPAAKWTMQGILSAFSNLPKEYVELTGLKRIIIMTGSAGAEVAGYAVTSGAHDTFFIDIEKGKNIMLDQHGILHETYHLLDAAQCGPQAMLVDEGFTQQNSPNPIYRTERDGVVEEPSVPSMQSYDNAVMNRRAMFDSSTPKSVLCQTQMQEDQEAALVETYSSYHPNPAEDKAEIGAQLVTPNDYVTITDTRFAKFWPKVQYLMARLYHQNPAIVEYFTETGRRPSYSRRTEC